MSDRAQETVDTEAGQSRSVEATFLGGVRRRENIVLWPLARLSVSDEGIHLAPALGLLIGIVRPLTLPEESIEMAERISGVGVVPAPGVRFVFADEREPVIFWTLRPGRLLHALERDGVQVVRIGRRAPFWGT